MSISGAGLILDLEVAAEVQAGEMYSLGATTFTVFDAKHLALQKYMCQEAFELPVTPTATRVYPPPHMTRVYPPPHMTCMYPPPLPSSSR